LTTNKSIKNALLVYWLLLIYIIAALLWWFISLEKQNTDTFTKAKSDIIENNSNTISPAIEKEIVLLYNKKTRNTAKHIGEGITFLAIICFGAIYIYRMVRKQIKLNTQQNNFIMAVTHELKTPIAIAQLNIETILKHKLDETKQQKLLSNTKTELYRLKDLANNILVIAQLEKDGYQLQKDNIEFIALSLNTIQEIKNRNPNRNIIVSNEVAQFNINGDSLLLQLVITNLIDNALKYADIDSTVIINISTNNSKIELQVLDNGQGIPNEEKQKIFNKFYRLGNEITRSKKGTGLGLYLCKKIIDDHKGNIKVTDNKPQGTIFTITLNEYNDK
jgi:two-component system, OmpR family, sensor histidine kinase CiaH